MPAGSKFDEGKRRYDLIQWQYWPLACQLYTAYTLNDWQDLMNLCILLLEERGVRSITSVCLVLEHGARLHGEYNWQEVEPHRYTAAIMRHLEAHSGGEFRDPDTDEPHLSHIICSCMFLCWKANNEQDVTY